MDKNKILFMVSVFCLGVLVGYLFNCTSKPQSANDLLNVGFTIIDPQGYEIERFE